MTDRTDDHEQQMLRLCPHYGPSPARDAWIAGYTAALSAQPAEPVAWLLPSTAPKHYAPVLVLGSQPPTPLTHAEAVKRGWRPLADPQPARVPLTREQVVRLWGIRSDGPSTRDIVSYARAIERAHGITLADTEKDPT